MLRRPNDRPTPVNPPAGNDLPLGGLQPPNSGASNEQLDCRTKAQLVANFVQERVIPLFKLPDFSSDAPLTRREWFGRLGRTALTITIHTEALIGVRLVVDGTARRVGVKQGYAGPSDVRIDPVRALVIDPFLEEVMFRALPHWALNYGEMKLGNENGTKVTNWYVGFPISAMFALVHNRTPDGGAYAQIPISQFIAGMYLWYLQRNVGLPANLFSHELNNGTVLGYMAIERALKR